MAAARTLIDVGFDCPTAGCDEMIDASVLRSDYRAKTAGQDAHSNYSRTAVTCAACKGTFTVEVTADAEGQLMKIDNFPEVEVWFDDSEQGQAEAV
ncbi:hypothetical protein [Rhizobium tumorigenes]|uniref:Uncharacterized protein n=1 Tax=Rhizobium tumorigenes TaxID=2041385 RepID=A0AAF1K8E2_9HYPH|nr:hypothetical protein [Rhizobium tumorigenes]WFR97634.1 hypothetical protein PR017_20810 [Rhizobium tumorigenes]